MSEDQKKEFKDVVERLEGVGNELSSIEHGISDTDMRDNFYYDVVVPFGDLVSAWDHSASSYDE